MVSSILLAQRSFSYTVTRDSNSKITDEGDAHVTLSPMDDNGYITITVGNKVTRYFTYNYNIDKTNVGQGYVSFKIRNTITSEVFLMQLFDDRTLGVRIIDINKGDTITLYEN